MRCGLSGRDREIVERFELPANAPMASPYLMMLIGRSLERTGQRQRAIPYIRRALKRQTDDLALFANARPTGARMPIATMQLRAALEDGDPQYIHDLARSFVRQYPYSGGHPRLGR